MTSEIVVINSSCVALAADSAVTINGQKIYNNANKLFELSKFHPVAIMIFGNAKFGFFDWETIIKSYRRKTNVMNFTNLEAHALNFLAYICEDQFHNQNLEDNYIHSQIVDIAEAILGLIEGVSKREFPKQFSSKITQITKKAEVNQNEFRDDPPNFEWFNSNYGDDTEALFREIFSNYVISRKNFQLAKVLVYNHLCSTYLSPNQTGIVITGFGENDFLPKLIAINIDGYLDGKPRIRMRKHCDIEETLKNGGEPASIHSFAQGDVVEMFIEGLAPDNLSYIEKYFENALKKFSNEIFKVAGYGPNTNGQKISKAILTKKAKEFVKEQKIHFKEFRAEKHINPLLEAVKSLPKEEMANVAEALIELTSLKRRVSNDLESVGGPVDVAIVSKSDGFVWMRRKHYFPEQLNKGFTERQRTLTTLDDFTIDVDEENT